MVVYVKAPIGDTTLGTSCPAQLMSYEAQLDNERKRVRELELENESMIKQLVESKTKTAEAKQQAEQVLAVMVGNYKKA